MILQLIVKKLPDKILSHLAKNVKNSHSNEISPKIHKNDSQYEKRMRLTAYSVFALFHAARWPDIFNL